MSQTDIATLNQQFGLGSQLQFVMGAGAMPIIIISNPLASASIAMQGAHLMTWAPRKHRPVVWLSPAAKYAQGKSIRGGIPICWPWFGPHATDGKLPGHGYARTVPWEVIATRALPEGSTHLAMRLIESDASRQQWPHTTPVEMHFSVGTRLSCDLVTHNTSSAALTIGAALHTYFAVSDVGQVRIHGLGNCTYIDKVDAGKRKTQSGAIQFSQETDRIYLGSVADCLIDDLGWQRRIRVHKRGSASTVVWNPWVDKAASMGDFGPDGYRRMVCVESANAADDVVVLKAGGRHRLRVEYNVESL
ncbi:MAG: D-hexose-6-phosphate mutarotase [Gammaproteobacteria bacterium]|nr:D-hexose-6-phosphate mutarotase [Gammaproteobacteria bacterium]